MKISKALNGVRLLCVETAPFIYSVASLLFLNIWQDRRKLYNLAHRQRAGAD